MTFYNVDNMTISQFTDESDVGDESIGNNTGQAILLCEVTKTSTEWGSDEAWESVGNNQYNLATLAVAELQTQYAGKEVDLDGIYINKFDV